MTHGRRFIAEFMTERFNYGGEIKTRGEIIRDIQSIFTDTDGGRYDKKYGDWFLFCFFQSHIAL